MRAGMDAAVRALARGALVAYPTDTGFGLAARADDRAAVARLFALKARPTGAAISVAVSSVEEIEPLAELADGPRAFLRRELPGPLTLLLPASARARRRFAPGLLGPNGSIGVRVPDHPVARELARRAGPITATSANRHGAPTPPDRRGLVSEFRRGVAVYLSGGPAPRGIASRIVDLTGPVPVVVRE